MEIISRSSSSDLVEKEGGIKQSKIFRGKNGEEIIYIFILFLRILDFLFIKYFR